MEYRLIRSARRSLCIQITPTGEVVVRAPFAVPNRQIEDFVLAKQNWIEQNRRKVLLRLQENPPPTDAQLQQLRRAAQAAIPPLVALYAERMGVKPTSVRINAARTRYGSCSSRHGLNFSCLVMRFPPQCVEYVVVHELAHIRHPDHSRSFWEEVERYLPDYRQRRAMMK